MPEEFVNVLIFIAIALISVFRIVGKYLVKTPPNEEFSSPEVNPELSHERDHRILNSQLSTLRSIEETLKNLANRSEPKLIPLTTFVNEIIMPDYLETVEKITVTLATENPDPNLLVSLIRRSESLISAIKTLRSAAYEQQLPKGNILKNLVRTFRNAVDPTHKEGGEVYLIKDVDPLPAEWKSKASFMLLPADTSVINQPTQWPFLLVHLGYHLFDTRPQLRQEFT